MDLIYLSWKQTIGEIMKKTNFFDKTLTRQLSFSIGAVLSVMLLALGFFLSNRVKKTFRDVSFQYLDQITMSYTESTEKILEKEFAIGSTLTDMLEGYKHIAPESRRDYINQVLQETLISNPALVDSWTAWEPDALDGLDYMYANTENHDSTGRFIPYWTQVGSEISCTPLTDYETGSWYVDPIRRTKGKLIDPNLYEVGGKMIWVCGVAFPIRDETNTAVGVVGIDMSLETLSSMLKSAKIYDSGYLSLISDSGLTAVDADASAEGKTFKYYDDSDFSELFANARNSLELQAFTTDDGLLHIISPLKVNVADQTWFLCLNVPVSEVERDSNVIMVVITAGFIITLVVLFILSSIFISFVSKELKKGVSVLQNIAHGDGDLTVRIDTQKDNELGKMFNYFNETMEKLHKSISKVKEESIKMQQVGDVLANNMNDTAAAANEITANIESVNKEVQHQADNVKSADESVQKINTNVEKLINSIDSQSSCVVESSSAIEQMVANIRSVTNILKSNSETITSLEQASENGKTNVAASVQVTEKIREQSKSLLEASKIIQNIASQTNLLAMNAAIEAAHAGDAGKGFSVVADEIRKLSEDSSVQGKTITTNLKEVLDSIGAVADSSANTQTQFNEIYDLTQKVSQQELTIMHAMQEQSEGGGQVLEAMKEINDITVDVKNGGHEMQGAAESVKNEMANLIRITDEIIASMQEMSQGIEDINHSMNEVNDQTHKTSESIESLSEVVNTFKV